MAITHAPVYPRAASRPFPLPRALAVVGLFALPALVYFMWICVEYNGGALTLPLSADDWRRWARVFPLPTWTAAAMAVGWLAFQALLQVLVPGPWREGQPLADGSRLRYKMNGWLSFWITFAALGALVAAHAITPSVVAEHFGPLLTTFNLITFALAVFLYLHRPPAGGARAPSTGSVLYDFWLGRERNPRLGSFDIKFFCESRPGLIGWLVLDLSLLARQYQLHGMVTTPMILVNAFHVFYVADYFYHEPAILTTFDIMHEDFGWMLSWGDLVWVPFTYTLQAYYLVNHTHPLSAPAVIGLVLLNLAGYSIFRGANIQKHHFRTEPERPVWGKPAEFIRTRRGPLLLTSGWWGRARHINYFGDLLMALAWCLPTGFHHPLPYFYFVYFTILLVHRERRDHARCLAKYGQDWETYCRTVPWRIVPGVY